MCLQGLTAAAFSPLALIHAQEAVYYGRVTDRDDVSILDQVGRLGQGDRVKVFMACAPLVVLGRITDRDDVSILDQVKMLGCGEIMNLGFGRWWLALYWVYYGRITNRDDVSILDQVRMLGRGKIMGSGFRGLWSAPSTLGISLFVWRTPEGMLRAHRRSGWKNSGLGSIWSRVLVVMGSTLL